jgi:hypothetical protein
MQKFTRRDFVWSVGALSAGYVTRSRSAVPSNERKPVRAPAVGQSWRYAKRDYFTASLVDTQTDSVSRVDDSIVIESHFESTVGQAAKTPSWGERWTREHAGPGAEPSGSTVEVQKPWGMIIVDPHWSEPQVFEKALPLWPTELRPGWSATVNTKYMIPDSDETMPTQLTMTAQEWESVTVPAGQFTALRFYNIIDFRFPNASERTAALRQERVWFVPEIGRWAVRESRGNYREDMGTEVKEGSYRWELLSWT